MTDGIIVPTLLADLGLERSPNAQRGLLVWAAIFACFAVLTLLLWRRAARGQSRFNGHAHNGAGRGKPFMKKTFVAVVQVASGILIVYVLARLTEAKPKRPEGSYLISPPHEVTVLARQGDIIWAGGKEGLYRVDRKSRRILADPHIQSRDLRGSRALLVNNRELWIGCRQGLLRYDGLQIESFTPPGRNDIGPVTALCRSRDGSLWVGVENGAWQTDADLRRWRWFGQERGITLPSIDVIYQTRDGILWFGSNAPEAAGIFRFNPETETFADISTGLSSHATNDLLEDHSGTLWIATGFGSRGAAASLHEGRWSELTNLPGIGGEKIRSLFEDSRQRLWLCSEYNGVAIREDGRWKRVTMNEGLPGSEVKDMLQEEGGTLWLATERGLGCLQTMP